MGLEIMMVQMMVVIMLMLLKWLYLVRQPKNTLVFIIQEEDHSSNRKDKMKLKFFQIEMVLNVGGMVIIMVMVQSHLIHKIMLMPQSMKIGSYLI